VPDVPPRRVLLTGAGGFVGRHLCAALAVAYPNAVLLTAAVEVRDAAAVADLVAANTPEVCVHLAAVSAVAAARSDEDRAWEVNLNGTLHLARAVLRHAPDCHLLFASTADAYGGSNPDGRPIDESAPLAPRSAYAASKAAADLALGSMVGQGLRVVRLRPFNHTGPGQSADFVIPAFARQIVRIGTGLQPPVLEVGNLDTWRDFLDVRDVCAAYIACIARRNSLPAGVILNISSGRSHRIGDVLAELMAIADVTADVRAAQSRTRANDVQWAGADASRAHMLLGWAPVVPWSQTLRDVLDDWRVRVASAPKDA
jgi:GDP-4-dehydro-6-deoxy-D-mannose reductase